MRTPSPVIRGWHGPCRNTACMLGEPETKPQWDLAIRKSRCPLPGKKAPLGHGERGGQKLGRGALGRDGETGGNVLEKTWEYKQTQQPGNAGSTCHRHADDSVCQRARRRWGQDISPSVPLWPRSSRVKFSPW